MRYCFKIGIILSILLLLAITVFGHQSGIKNIYIITPEWEDSTNKDGTGLYFDIVRSIYEPLGIRMTYKIVPWKRAKKMIKEKKADAMFCVIPNNCWLTPKYPIFVESVAAVFKKDKIKDWRGIESLESKDVMWLRGYAYHEDNRIKDIRLKRIQEIDHYYQAWGMLERERTDVYMDELIDIDMYIRKNKVDMQPYRIEILWSRNTYMGFSDTEKSKKLIEIYDIKIIEIFKSGELEKLHKKWGVRYRPEAWSR